jgi:hypothetical protein
LLGSSIVEEYPDEYNVISIVKKAGDWKDFDAFQALPIHTRAKLIAHSYLENIVEILGRHDSLQKQKVKAMENRHSG